MEAGPLFAIGFTATTVVYLCCKANSGKANFCSQTGEPTGLEKALKLRKEPPVSSSSKTGKMTAASAREYKHETTSSFVKIDILSAFTKHTDRT